MEGSGENTLYIMLNHPPTHTNTHTSLTHSHSHTHTLPHTHTHTHTLIHSLSHTHTHSRAYIHTLSLTHSHTHTHTHTCTGLSISGSDCSDAAAERGGSDFCCTGGEAGNLSGTYLHVCYTGFAYMYIGGGGEGGAVGAFATLPTSPSEINICLPPWE